MSMNKSILQLLVLYHFTKKKPDVKTVFKTQLWLDENKYNKWLLYSDKHLFVLFTKVSLNII